MNYEGVKTFLGNPLVATLLAALFTYIGWRFGHRRAKPTVWLTAARQLTWGKTGDLPEDFEIRYRAKAVHRVSRGTVVLWNAGNDTFDHESVSEKDRIRISIPDGEFLEAEILRLANNTSGIVATISEDKREVGIEFEYMDSNEGVTMAFLHTSTQIHPEVKGRVKGNKIRFFDDRSKGIDKRPASWSLPKRRKFVFGVLFAMGVIFALIGLMKIYFPSVYELLNRWPFDQNSKLIGWIPMFMGLSYIVLALYFLWSDRRKYPKSLEYRTDELTTPQTAAVQKESIN